MSSDRAGPAKPSLQDRLARHVVVPLVLTWAMGTGAVLSVANHFTGQAFDRSLLDDAYALAVHVRAVQGGLALALTPGEMSTLLFDQSESNYFAVLDAQGALVAGHAGLRPPPLPGDVSYEFADIVFQGKTLRSVSLRHEQPDEFVVVMAQTTASRRLLLHRLLLYSATPQVLLLLFLAWWLRRVVARDLGPLAQLHQAMDRRDASDLRPLPDTLIAASTSRDVERLGTALNSLLSRLHESLAGQREFAGNVAHELRTPLAGIRAQAGYALARSDPAVWRRQLQGIAEGEQRASHLVDQLLALARAGEGVVGLRSEVLVLTELVRETVLRFLPKADAAGVDLGAEGLDDPVHVRGDKALVEGMLGNLLDNALRYGRAPRPQVTVAIQVRADEVELSVSDNGPGLDSREATQLRGRWAQGPQGRQLGRGSGLGLAIVSRYAELLGASFSLRPVPDGTGLCAVLRFTVVRPDSMLSSAGHPAPH